MPYNISFSRCFLLHGWEHWHHLILWLASRSVGFIFSIEMLLFIQMLQSQVTHNILMCTYANTGTCTCIHSLDHPGSSDRPRASFPHEKEQLFIKRFRGVWPARWRVWGVAETNPCQGNYWYPSTSRKMRFWHMKHHFLYQSCFPSLQCTLQIIVSVPLSTVDSGVDSSQATSGTAYPSTPLAEHQMLAILLLKMAQLN